MAQGKKAIRRRLVKAVRRVAKLPGDGWNPYNEKEYNLWIRQFEKDKKYRELKYRPKFSVIVPLTDSVKGDYLGKCLQSILKQGYDEFEIFLIMDETNEEKTKEALSEFEDDARIKTIKYTANKTIEKTINEVINNKTKGEFVVFVGSCDMLSENALYRVVEALNQDKKLDLIYSDSDEIDASGKRINPHFKPDFSPNILLGFNYISGLAAIRKKVIKQVGGIKTIKLNDSVGISDKKIVNRKDSEAQRRKNVDLYCFDIYNYDLYLRVTERTDKIYHIPKILYHERIVKKDEDYQDLIKKVLEEAMQRRAINAKVRKVKDTKYCYIDYEVKDEPLISVIIPTCDAASILKRCLDSIFDKTTYKNYEVIVIDNNSKEDRTFELFKEYKDKYKNFRVIEAKYEFNYAKINNTAVKECVGDYVLLLNNDTEVITPEWMELMLGYASQKWIGAVGAQLLYKDNTVQHAGVVLGVGVAAHVLVGKKQDEEVPEGRLSIPYDYSAVTAACLMVSKKKWNEVGGMDENLKVAYNDVDFCLKLLAKGYYNVCLPMVKLYHYESKTRGMDDTPEKKARFDWEQMYMYRKWAERIQNDEFYNANFSRKKVFRLDKGK